MNTAIFDFAYLISVALFIVGLKGLSHPDTARKGNIMAAGAMLLAILVTLVYPVSAGAGNYWWIAVAITIGSIIGWVSAKRVQLTKMPEMVSLFNGLGGATSMFIGVVELYNYPANQSLATGGMLTTVFALFVGAVSFTGSIVAWGKLNGSLRDSLKLPAPTIVNLILLLANIAAAAYLMSLDSMDLTWVWVLTGLSLVYGVTFVAPIGGGDMPVVISLLNSLTGVAASAAGLIYGNQVMVTGGILVGASGTILTVMMCKAMNRSLFSVIVGGFGSAGASSTEGREGNIKEASLADTAILLKYSQKVVIVPGYGLAVAQAQHTCHELEKRLESEGVEVKYAIHPVAGRMPGHMNVLLAEADVSYDKLMELEVANNEFASTDVVMVIGANDVVNPGAKEDPGSPIYGMPILEVELAKHVIVLKRGMSAGYSGVENPLFFGEKTKMLFGDAKASLAKLADEVGNA